MNNFHTALLGALASKGLTPTHIATLVDDGFETPSQVLRLSITDLKSMLGIKGGLASDILSVAESAKSGDFDTAQTGETALIQTLLENLIGSDANKTSAVSELRGRSILWVAVNEDDGLLVGETMRLLASPDRKVAERAGLWNDLKLVKVETFLPDTTPLRSPYGDETLVEGRDIRTGIAWGELPLDRLGLAVWLVEEKMDAGLPQREVFADLKAGGELYQRALKLSRAHRVTESYLRKLAKVRTDSARRPGRLDAKVEAPSRIDLTGTPWNSMSSLLLDVFPGSSPLRIFFVNKVGFKTWELPAEAVSFGSQVFDLMQSYRSRCGEFGREFFDLLRQECPGRRRDIDLVAAKFGC